MSGPCFGLVGRRLRFKPLRPKYLELPAPPLWNVLFPLGNGAAGDVEQLGQGLGAACTGNGVLGFHGGQEFSTLNTMRASQLNKLTGLICPMTLAERIKEAIGERSPASVADAIKASRGAVSLWLSGGIKSLKAENAARLEALTGYSAAWIATGKGEKMLNHPNVQPVTTKGRVPLISWVTAGNLGEIEDMYQPGEADNWIDTETKPGANSFALRVSGDSMTSPYPGELSFPDGTVIVVDPSRSCNAGDFVVAKDVATQQATFKRLAHDGGRWFLKPLNPSYPTLEIDDPAMRVIGRVIEYRHGGKL